MNQWLLDNKVLISIYSSIFQTIVMIVVPVVLYWWANKEQQRKEVQAHKDREFDMLSKFIERHETIFSLGHRDREKETKEQKLKFLGREFVFILRLETMMENTKYYRFLWLKSTINLLEYIIEYQTDFSVSLIEKVENRISVLIDCIVALLLQDEEEAEKVMKKPENIILTKELKVKIDKEIDNIKKGISNKDNKYE